MRIKSPSNAHAHVSSGASGIQCGLSHNQHPNFEHASSEGSGEYAWFAQTSLSLSKQRRINLNALV